MANSIEYNLENAAFLTKIDFIAGAALCCGLIKKIKRFRGSF